MALNHDGDNLTERYFRKPLLKRFIVSIVTRLTATAKLLSVSTIKPKSKVGPDCDPEQVAATRLYRIAAEQGVAGAQCRLGVLYAEGRGVERDDHESIRWFLLAAAQGDAEAQASLGLSYGSGRGVSLNFVTAHMWLTLASEQLAGMMQTRTRRFRDTIAAGMTATQIAEAQQLAADWKTNHPMATNSEPLGGQ